MAMSEAETKKYIEDARAARLAKEAEELKAENARQAKASFDFLTKHLDYVNNTENNAKIAAYLTAKMLPWTEDSLEEAYRYLSENEEFSSAAPVVPAPTPAPEPECPWEFPLTPKYIRELSPAKYKEFYADPRFRQQVDDLKIRKS
jgi:hypothetical protein